MLDLGIQMCTTPMRFRILNIKKSGTGFLRKEWDVPVRGLHMSGDRLYGEELCGAVYAAEALLAVRAGAPVLRPHVRLQAHLQRELLPAESAVVLQRRDSHQLIN
jgi:hypothetical protein